MISIICGLSDPNLVFMAATMTCALFAALTLYACTTKSDFTLMGGALFACSIVMMIAGKKLLKIKEFKGLFLMFTDNNAAHIIYSCFGVCLFSLYVVYDT